MMPKMPKVKDFSVDDFKLEVQIFKKYKKRI